MPQIWSRKPNLPPSNSSSWASSKRPWPWEASTFFLLSKIIGDLHPTEQIDSCKITDLCTGVCVLSLFECHWSRENKHWTPKKRICFFWWEKFLLLTRWFWCYRYSQNPAQNHIKRSIFIFTLTSSRTPAIQTYNIYIYICVCVCHSNSKPQTSF